MKCFKKKGYEKRFLDLVNSDHYRTLSMVVSEEIR